MNEHRCIHEMLPGQCSICLGIPDEALYMSAAVGEPGHRARVTGHPDGHARTRGALKTTRCPRCREWIEPGDLLTHDDAMDWWVCESCAGAEL